MLVPAAPMAEAPKQVGQDDPLDDAVEIGVSLFRRAPPMDRASHAARATAHARTHAFEVRQGGRGRPSPGDRPGSGTRAALSLEPGGCSCAIAIV